MVMAIERPKVQGAFRLPHADRTPPIVAVRGGDVRIRYATGSLQPAHDSAYFWTEEWQAGEREADEEIKAGRMHHFDNPEDALAFLEDLR